MASNQQNRAKGSGSVFGSLMQDLRYAVRMFRKNPGLTLVVVVSLAIGIGANTAVFSVTDALLLRPLRYPEPDRLAILWLRSPGIGIPQDWPSPGQYNDIKTQNNVFEETAITIGQSVNLTGLTRPERVDVMAASSSLFHILGARTELGRTFLPEEDAPGKPDTAVLSFGTWKGLFGSDPQILEKSITLNGKPYAVVGVLKPGFEINHETIPTVGGIDKAQIFLPLPLAADDPNSYGPEDYNIIARVKPGVTMSQAQADVDVISSRIREQQHRDPSFTISVVPLQEQVVGNVRRAVLVLLGAVALVLLIACGNVANLLLARASVRQKEIAVRTALGAGWTRIARQLLTESILLALIGGAAGLVIAALSLSAMRLINPGNIPRLNEIGLDGRVLVFTFGIALLSGVIFGLAPALRASRVDLNSALKEGGRSAQAGGGLGSGRDKLRSLLVVAELSLSLMLLIGAGLLIRSFIRLQNVPAGFNPDHVTSLRVSATGSKYEDSKQRIAFYKEVAERIQRLPGVTGQGAVTALPLTPSVGWGGIEVEGYTPPPSEPELQVDQRTATPGYFETMGIPLIKGRFFSNLDTGEQNSPPAVLVDQKMADRFWFGQDPIGKRVRNGPKSPWLNVVGVVGIVKQYGLDTDTRMVVYFPHTQRAAGSMYLVARSSSETPTLAGAITSEVHTLDPDATVYDVSSMEDRLRGSLARQRFSTTMLGAFAAFAIILAAIGVYAVLSYMVNQGTRDIGVRLALGAQQSAILGLVVKQGMALASIGITAGLIGAVALTRVMASLLFQVGATDLLTFSGVTVLMALVAFAACYIPARRAMRVDPMSALRYE